MKKFFVNSKKEEPEAETAAAETVQMQIKPEEASDIPDKTIENLDRAKCTGCGACYNKCPECAIKMEYDSEGFLFPYVLHESCINCGLCMKVCPELNIERTENLIHEEGECYAMMADDELRMKSSSGGMFTLLAERILEQGGAVCGAEYTSDYMGVQHSFVYKTKDLERLRSSKYVQSDTKDTYSKTEELLKAGRKVLFTGCPCQVAGLYSFLGKDYENLYTADLVCHGANSTAAYKSYITEVANGREIKEVNFRDKSVFGWSTPTTIYFKDGSVFNAAWDQSEWNNGFLKGIINRNCCAACRYAQRKRAADITLGDFWQIFRYKESLNDWKGTSLVLLNTEKGKRLFNETKSKMKLCEEAPLDFAVKYNGQLVRPNAQHPGRRFFFHHLEKDGYHKALWYGKKLHYDVGLVGWWFAANYGSVMTYFALGKILEDMDLLAIMVRIPQKNNHPWEPVTEKNVEFMQKYFPVTKPRRFGELEQCSRFCDAFMLGSDQLWVQGYVKQVGYTFFLDFPDESKRKIAYATSLGYDRYSGTDEEKSIVEAYLKTFDAISVRESSGVDICRNDFHVDAVRKLDPVFVCDTRHYDMLADNADIETPPKYLLCYILDPSEEKKKAVLYLEKMLGLKAVVILDMKTYERAKQVWGMDNVMPNGSIENFIKLIKNCSFLVSDSHHGICFGLIYHKNFICIANRSRGYARFTSLFDLLGIRKHMVDSADEIVGSKALLESVDYEKVDSVLRREKEEALIWLKEALTSERRKKDEQELLLVRSLNKLHKEELENEKLKNETDRLGKELNALKGGNA